MTIDFKAEVDKRKDAMMEDLFSLLRINSERDDSQADSTHPFGPGPVKALEHFLAMAERDGYKARNIDAQKTKQVLHHSLTAFFYFCFKINRHVSAQSS